VTESEIRTPDSVFASSLRNPHRSRASRQESPLEYRQALDYA